MKKLTNNLIILSYLIITILCVILLDKLNIFRHLKNILDILIPLFIGIVISWLLKPVVNKANNKKEKIYLVVLMYLLITIAIYGLVKSFIPILIREINEFVNIIPSIIDKISNILKFKLLDSSLFYENIVCSINEYSLKISRELPNMCMCVIMCIINLAIGFIIGFYLLIDDFSIDIKNRKLKKLVSASNDILRIYLNGTLISSLIILILSLILFSILKFDNALFLACLNGITNFIPFVGPYIGGIIPVLIGFTKSISTGLVVTIIMVILQTIEGNIIHPLIIKKSINIHPVASIVCVLVFGYYLGIIGMIVSVPIVAIIKESYIIYRE